MKVMVRILVEAHEARAPYPSTLTFEHEHTAGDNPAFYGSEMQEAVGQASLAAMQGIEPYVRYKIGETS